MGARLPESMSVVSACLDSTYVVATKMFAARPHAAVPWVVAWPQQEEAGRREARGSGLTALLIAD